MLSLPPKEEIVTSLEWPTSKWFLPDFPRRHSHEANRNPITGSTYSRPSLHRPCVGHGILTVCPSGAALAIPLGPTNPQLITIAEETLVFRRAGFSPALWLLVPTFLLQHAPVWVTPLPSSQIRTLSYRLANVNICSNPQFRHDA